MITAEKIVLANSIFISLEVFRREVKEALSCVEPKGWDFGYRPAALISFSITFRNAVLMRVW